MNRSIRRRLLGALLGAVSVAWALAAVTSYLDIHHEVEELFDAQLAQSAKLLLAISPHELKEQILLGGVPEVSDLDLSKYSYGHEYEHKVAFQIWILPDRLAVRSSSAPREPLSHQQNGYTDTHIDNQHWRVFSIVDSKNSIMVQLSERADIREELTDAIAFRMMQPVLVLLPLLALLIWYGVGYAMRPLDRLASEIRSRAPSQLHPIDHREVPVEARPIVDSMNGLFSRLAQAFENERRFTADASHELRTPLAGLKTQAQVALQANDPEIQRTALRQVVAGVDQATHMVQQLLTLARLDPETDLIGAGKVELCELATDVLADIAFMALEKNLDLSLADPCRGRVAGSRNALAILLRNLVDNAIRYTPDNGAVQVQIETTESGVLLRVLDSGPGIPPEEHERVFERFYRRLGTQASGSGLGLSIVGRIAELHHATITLNHASLGGLEAVVRFPPTI